MRIRPAFGGLALSQRGNPLVSSPMDTPFRMPTRSFGGAATPEALQQFAQMDANNRAAATTANNIQTSSKFDVNAAIAAGSQLLSMFGNKQPAPPAVPSGATYYPAPTPPPPVVQSGMPWWAIPAGLAVAALGVAATAAVVVSQGAR